MEKLPILFYKYPYYYVTDGKRSLITTSTSSTYSNIYLLPTDTQPVTTPTHYLSCTNNHFNKIKTHTNFDTYYNSRSLNRQRHRSFTASTFPGFPTNKGLGHENY